mgnify:FL=1
MRHRKKGATLSRTASARGVLARKLAISFLTHGRIETTHARARFLRSFVEPLITTAKPGDLSARRGILAALGDRAAVVKLLQRAEGYRDRPGGYTRISRLRVRRKGDGSQQVLIEFV